jgi:hypothetical protein
VSVVPTKVPLSNLLSWKIKNQKPETKEGRRYKEKEGVREKNSPTEVV